MNIGILTFHRAHNYGAMLQAYALKEFLVSNGHNVSFIDYWPKDHLKEYSLFRIGSYSSLISFLKAIAFFFLTFFKRYLRIKNFNSFLNNKLEVKGKIRFVERNQINVKGLDVVVVGSDQVWRNYGPNMFYYGYDPAYFCEECMGVKCISYAASAGIINNTDNEVLFLQKHLSNFASISVREKKLHDFLLSIGFDSTIVCDPTFLLDRKQWNSLIPPYRYRKEPYVLFYELLESERAFLIAQTIGEKMNASVHTITARAHVKRRKNENQTASPIDFLHAIRDSEFVVCTSFHGTAFSIIFRKQFATLGIKNSSDRVISLLSEIGLESRYVADDGKLPEEAINYNLIENRLEKYVCFSKKYLEDNLK